MVRTCESAGVYTRMRKWLGRMARRWHLQPRGANERLKIADYDVLKLEEEERCCCNRTFLRILRLSNRIEVIECEQTLLLKLYPRDRHSLLWSRYRMANNQP